MKQNLHSCSPGVKEAAYKTLVRPHVEYSSAAWDPYHANKIKQIEMVQRSAARWVTSNYERTASVTAMLNTLGWHTLQQRRLAHRLVLFHRIILGSIAIYIPSYIEAQTVDLRSKSFIQPYARTELYRNSYFPRTISEWKRVPPDISAITDTDRFKAAVESYVTST